MLMTRDKKFYRTVLALAIPMVLQNLITFLVTLADNMMIGHLGDSAVSGVYMGAQIQTYLQVLSAGIEGGILLIAAQYWGRGNKESIRRIVSIGVWFSLLLGAAVTLICALIPWRVVGVFTSETAVAEKAVEYLSVVCFSYIFFCLTQALIVSMRSVESARIGLVVSSCSLVIDICLNYILIFGKLGFSPMGIKGAAVATLIARITEFIIIAIYVRFVDRKLCFRLPMLLCIDRGLLRDFIRYGLPIIAGQLVWGINLASGTAIIGRFSESIITAMSLANTVNSMIYVCMNGLSGAVGIVIGKTVGSGDISKIREYAKTVQIMFLTLGIMTGAMFAVICEPFIGCYNISGEAAAYSRQFIHVLCFTSIGTCYQCGCLFGLVKSGGDVSFVFKNDTVAIFGVVLPSAIITAVCGCPPWVVFLCLKSDQIFKCVVAFFKIRKYNWMKNLTKTSLD